MLVRLFHQIKEMEVKLPRSYTLFMNKKKAKRIYCLIKLKVIYRTYVSVIYGTGSSVYVAICYYQEKIWF